jgi:hypothetical protein
MPSFGKRNLVMRYKAHVSVFPLVVLLCTLGLTSSGWAKSFGQIKSEHAIYEGKCLEANSTNDWIINLRKCDSTRAEQLWFVTRAYPSDGTLKTDETVRSVRWPNRCMTDVDLKLKQGRVLALRQCYEDELTSDQLWEPRNFRTRIGSGRKCISVSENKGFVRPCKWGAARQKFDFTNVGKVTNFDLGNFIEDNSNVTLPNDHRFHNYRECADQNGAETTCFINFGDEGKYGYRLGTEFTDGFRGNLDDRNWVARFIDKHYSGTQEGEKTLDLGDRYSADRCALAHDLWYWAPQFGKGASISQSPEYTKISKPDAVLLAGWQNWIGMSRCINAVRPTTIQENNAIELADGFIDGLDAFFRKIYPSPRFGVCLPDEDLGNLPQANALVLPCTCRQAINADDLDIDVIGNVCSEDHLVSLQDTVQADGTMLSWLPEVAGEAYIALLIDRAQAAPEPETRLFAQGDWVWRIAKAKGSKDIQGYISGFEALNPGVDANLVYIGQSYLLPPP